MVVPDKGEPELDRASVPPLALDEEVLDVASLAAEDASGCGCICPDELQVDPVDACNADAVELEL